MQITLIKVELFDIVKIHAVEDKDIDSIFLFVKGEGETSLYEWGNQTRFTSHKEMYKTIEHIALRALNRASLETGTSADSLKTDTNLTALRQFLLDHWDTEKVLAF